MDQIFKGALVKLANGYPLVTEAEQHESVSCLLKPAGHDADDAFDGAAVNIDGNKLSYVRKVEYHRKRKKIKHENVVSKYVNLDVLCGTLVECERLFSVDKNILTDTRKGTSLAVFQALLLLKVNRKEWEVYTVGKAIQGLMSVLMLSLLEKWPMIMNSIMKKRSIYSCNSYYSHSPYTVHFSTQF